MSYGYAEKPGPCCICRKMTHLTMQPNTTKYFCASISCIKKIKEPLGK